VVRAYGLEGKIGRRFIACRALRHEQCRAGMPRMIEPPLWQTSIRKLEYQSALVSECRLLWPWACRLPWPLVSLSPLVTALACPLERVSSWVAVGSACA
jgi:hypothetical protein